MVKKTKLISESIKLIVPNSIVDKPSWIRLEDQLDWYDQKSLKNQKWYKILKITQILLAVSIPIFSHLPNGYGIWITSIAGGLIAVFEALEHLNQYSTLWITYRSTAEKLKHEKYLFLSEAGPYINLEEHYRFILLAERIEEHVSTEHANWFNETRKLIFEKKEKTNDTTNK